MTFKADLTNLKTALESVQTPAGREPIKRVWMNPSEKTPVTAECPCFVVLWRKPVSVRVPQFTFA